MPAAASSPSDGRNAALESVLRQVVPSSPRAFCQIDDSDDFDNIPTPRPQDAESLLSSLPKSPAPNPPKSAIHTLTGTIPSRSNRSLGTVLTPRGSLRLIFAPVVRNGRLRPMESPRDLLAPVAPSPRVYEAPQRRFAQDSSSSSSSSSSSQIAMPRAPCLRPVVSPRVGREGFSLGEGGAVHTAASNYSVFISPRPSRGLFATGWNKSESEKEGCTHTLAGKINLTPRPSSSFAVPVDVVMKKEMKKQPLPPQDNKNLVPDDLVL